MTALCRDCDMVHGETRKLAPYKWRCLKRPRHLEAASGLEFVDPDWHPDPPYALCTNSNRDGDCEFFTPRRTGQKEAAE